MRRIDERREGWDVAEAMAADTVGAPLPQTPPTWRAGAAAVGMRPRLGIGVAAVLAIAALGAVLALSWHADTTRDNEGRLQSIIAKLGAVEETPWRYQTSLASGQSLTAPVVMQRLGSAQQAIVSDLHALRQSAPTPALAAVERPLRFNFAGLGAMVRIIASGNLIGLQTAANTVFRTFDTVVAALHLAESEYQSRADGTLWQATIGTALVIALLLGGFVFFYWRSVKARMAAEALAVELELSREHLEHAQSVVGVGSWEWNEPDRVLRWSPEQCRLHGWMGPQPPPSPRAFLKLIAPDDRRRVNLAMKDAFIDGKSIDLEYRVAESRGGRLVRVQVASSVAPNGGRRVIGTSQDMTDRFRRAEAERANRAKDEFISRMSHELRTPLNAVLGFGQLMSMSDLDERQRGNVGHILSAGNHLLDLINEILDISRIESGDLRLSLEPVGLGSVLADAVDLVSPVALEHDITISTDAAAGRWVRADVQRLRQVLLNLLSNAVKYNFDGGHVWVRTRVDEAAGRIQIEVQDDGAGIAPDMMERLFSPFERLGAEQTPVEGTGLGLAVSRGMIEAMGGRISVRSEPGEGSTFTLELPVAAAPAAIGDPDVAIARRRPAAAAARRAPIADREPRDGSVQVLCIEDNEANIELIEQILAERPTVQLLTSRDGTGGLRIARDVHPDLVLLDLDLPDIDGAEVLTELKHCPATASIPVVILSAADTAADARERLLALGARAYITKPPGVTALLEAVDAVTPHSDPAESVA